MLLSLSLLLSLSRSSSSLLLALFHETISSWIRIYDRDSATSVRNERTMNPPSQNNHFHLSFFIVNGRRCANCRRIDMRWDSFPNRDCQFFDCRALSQREVLAVALMTDTVKSKGRKYSLRRSRNMCFGFWSGSVLRRSISEICSPTFPNSSRVKVYSTLEMTCRLLRKNQLNHLPLA